ncbi:MAG TPA: helix-turn-helix transcriptional regulator [Candidatus Udaeobacter sp.]|nr:helix-turn-helix transcriptional regulator [Candidatus Udaeobacter sp.]
MGDLWQSAALRKAASEGDTGTVIKLARRAKGLTQRQLGEAVGYSQPVISRIECGEHDAHDVRLLALLAGGLDIPYHLLGLAEPKEPPVRRRQFLTVSAAAAGSAVLPFDTDATPEQQQAAELRHVTGAYRRLDSVAPGRELVEPATAHLGMAVRILDRAEAERRAPLAEAVSEAAGLAAWLAWDGANTGTARAHYATAIKAARASRNRLLSAYQTGSLASLSADQGDAAEALTLLRSARAQLGADRNATADAWLSSLEALAHAAAGEARQAWTALDRAEAAACRIVEEGPPPWPWVFAFDGVKVAAHRLSCAARLRQGPAGIEAAGLAAPLLAGGHARQRALLAFDLAEAHIAAGHIDEAIAIAEDALTIAAPFTSGRVADRARSFRRRLTGRIAPGMLRGFDEQLRSAYT